MLTPPSPPAPPPKHKHVPPPPKTPCPGQGVNADYDEAHAVIEQAERALKDYLHEQRRATNCRQLGFVSLNKESHVLEAPEVRVWGVWGVCGATCWRRQRCVCGVCGGGGGGREG